LWTIHFIGGKHPVILIFEFVQWIFLNWRFQRSVG
jgi:hypothetical protein